MKRRMRKVLCVWARGKEDEKKELRVYLCVEDRE